MYLTLSLVVLSLGGGGIATLLSLLSAEIPASAQYAVIVLTSLSAVALSGFIIHGLQGIKARGKELLDIIAPPESAVRAPAELEFGSDLRAFSLAQAAQASALLAVATNGAMLATTAARTAMGNTALLPLGWLVANALLTSGSNLAGFVLFSSLGERNRLLLVKAHENELEVKEAQKSSLRSDHDKAIFAIHNTYRSELGHRDEEMAALTDRNRVLEKRLKAAVSAPTADSESSPVATDLFRRRSCVASLAASVAQQQVEDGALATEVGAGAVPSLASSPQ